MVSAGVAIGVVGATISFAVLRTQRMLRADDVEERVGRRHRNVRYRCGRLGVDLRRIVVEEPDSTLYELGRLFMIRPMRGETELLFALEDVKKGEPVGSEPLRFDEDYLRDLLGDVFDSGELYDAYGNGRVKMTVKTTDADVIERITRHLPYHLADEDEESEEYAYFEDRSASA